jgi:hypothetical protein
VREQPRVTDGNNPDNAHRATPYERRAYSAPCHAVQCGCMTVVTPSITKARKALSVELRGVAATCGAAAIGAGVLVVSPGSPTGTALADVWWKALFGALVVAALSAQRRALLAATIVIALCAALGAAPVALIAAALAVMAAMTQLHRIARRTTGSVLASGGLTVALSRLNWPDQHGATAVIGAVVGVVAVACALRSGDRALRVAARAGSAVVVVAVVVILGGASLESRRSAHDARALQVTLDQLVTGASRGDRSLVSGQLGQLSIELESIESTLQSPWLRAATAIPLVGQQIHFTTDVVHAARDVQRTTTTLVDAADPRRLVPTPATIDTVVVGQVSLDARTSMDSFTQLSQALDTGQQPWLAPALRDRSDRVRQRIDRISGRGDQLVALAQLLPRLLGDREARRYLLVVATPSELRGAIGLPANYAEIGATNGKLSLDKSGRIASLGPIAKANNAELVAPDDYIARYRRLGIPEQWTEVAASPDFVATASVMSSLYPNSGGQRVDGVVAIDPRGLAQLLEVTGPVAVSGWNEPLTVDNAERILLFDQYVTYANDPITGRSAFLTLATTEIWNALVQRQLDLPRLAPVLLDMLANGHLMVTSNHIDEAAQLRAVDFDGGIGSPAPDSLVVSSLNRGGNKVDWFLQRTVHYRAVIDPTTRAVAATVDISLTNSAPSSGLPDYIIGGAYYAPSARGTNQQWLSIYSPWDLDRITVDGSPVGAETMNELGRQVHMIQIDIAPGTTARVQVTLKGTASTNAQDYRLNYVSQQLVTPERITIDVSDGGRTVHWSGDGVRRRHTFVLDP